MTSHTSSSSSWPFDDGGGGKGGGEAHPHQAHPHSLLPSVSDIAQPGSSQTVMDHRRYASVDACLIPRAEKDADDVTSPPSFNSSPRASNRAADPTALTTLSRLFAGSTDYPKNASFGDPSAKANADAFFHSHSMPPSVDNSLNQHLHSRGLILGRHSDLTVIAFGYPYKLHRLILDRAPFFASALSEPWLEANAKEMTVHPEKIDPSITRASFELALRRLYGCWSREEEDRDPVGLFATGCWLEMQDLIDSSVESMLRQMTTKTLAPLIELVTRNYYGRAGDKILASAKSMLCRDGWKMPMRCWDGIPGDIIREIVGGDGFFVAGEFDRWILTRRILDRRLKRQAVLHGLLEPGSRHRVMKVPESARLMAVRFDGVYRKAHAELGRGIPNNLQRWVTLYTHPDIEPLLVLLDEGIHYMHLDFEQLQFIRHALDCMGLPVMAEKVITDALWQQMELRQKVMNAREGALELGNSVQCTEDVAVPTRDVLSIHASSEPRPAHEKGKAPYVGGADDDIDSGSWDGNGKPRKFWIPSSDCNVVMGGAEPIIATSNNSLLQRHAGRLSATLQPEDVQWAADFVAITSQPRPPSLGPDPSQPDPLTVSYTHLPPFRFSAEFPNPRVLKEKKRIYSRTVFYAGSLWNIYIQKVSSSRSKQLGVYLHRAKEREAEEVIAGTAGMAHGSVDERIGLLEREMMMRSQRRERRQRARATMHSGTLSADDIDSSESAGVEDSASAHEPISSARASAVRSLLTRHQRRGKQAQPSEFSASMSATSQGSTAPDDEVVMTTESDSEDDDNEDPEAERLAATSRNFLTLPPYVDARPTIKTYFKIYSPSRGGRMLSVYESAPDKFNFSQSWGWKSSTLMLDESLLGNDDSDGNDDSIGAGDKENTHREMQGRGDGKLRFMIVIGNI